MLMLKKEPMSGSAFTDTIISRGMLTPFMSIRSTNKSPLLTLYRFTERAHP